MLCGVWNIITTNLVVIAKNSIFLGHLIISYPITDGTIEFFSGTLDGISVHWRSKKLVCVALIFSGCGISKLLSFRDVLVKLVQQRLIVGES